MQFEKIFKGNVLDVKNLFGEFESIQKQIETSNTHTFFISGFASVTLISFILILGGFFFLAYYNGRCEFEQSVEKEFSQLKNKANEITTIISKLTKTIGECEECLDFVLNNNFGVFLADLKKFSLLEEIWNTSYAYNTGGAFWFSGDYQKLSMVSVIAYNDTHSLRLETNPLIEVDAIPRIGESVILTHRESENRAILARTKSQYSNVVLHQESHQKAIMGTKRGLEFPYVVNYFGTNLNNTNITLHMHSYASISHLAIEQLGLYYAMGGFCSFLIYVLMIFAYFFFRDVVRKRSLDISKKLITQLEFQKHRIRDLIFHLVPKRLAKRLLKGESVISETICGLVMFIDFMNFTKISSSLEPSALMIFLRNRFQIIDTIMENYGIGDCFMGLKEKTDDHCCDKVIAACIDVINELRIYKQHVRIGVSIGEVAAGVVENKYPRYDVFGRNVNLASRLESTAPSNTIQVSEDVFKGMIDKRNLEIKLRKGLKLKGFSKNINTYIVRPTGLKPSGSNSDISDSYSEVSQMSNASEANVE